jgi:HCOMODA/2-hydroxy-3-carboxy-muconic semialdehyde decarboxylase
MRGHGFVAAGAALLQVLRTAVAMPKNARIYMEAMRLRPVKALSAREIEIRPAEMREETPAMLRAWEYWATRCGCGDLIAGGDEQARPS